eukprot:3297417-Rhodomonas_salina.1
MRHRYALLITLPLILCTFIFVYREAKLGVLDHSTPSCQSRDNQRETTHEQQRNNWTNAALTGDDIGGFAVHSTPSITPQAFTDEATSATNIILAPPDITPQAFTNEIIKTPPPPITPPALTNEMPQTFNNTRVLGRAIKNILVLGGGGVIGSALIKYLRKETPFTVSHVLNRGHHDLRVAGELDRFLAKRNKLPDFCFYLAYEVGGAKFINALEHDATIELYNNRIDDNVVATLERRHIPFLYASSRLAGSNTGYGRAKAYGERKVAGTTVGKTFRLWNIYGVEPIGPKAHVIPDWIWQCLQHPNGIVQSHANPDISRQFTHASDLAPTLVRMMASFDQLPNLSNLDSSPSSTLAQVARTLTAASDGKCTVRFPITATTSESINAVTDNTPLRTQLGTASDAVRIRQHHTMEDHIRRMMHYYRERHMNSTAVAEKRASAEPYLSIITAVRNDDFQGFGARFVHFVRELTRRAKAVNLLYELII